MVKIAITGIGFMGKTHLGIYNRLENAELVALCDIRQEALDSSNLDAGGNIESSAGGIDLSGVKKYSDFGTMLREGGFDVVDICLPTFLHAEYSIEALGAGYHVFCEKPMALNSEETGAILKKIKESGKFFSVGQCLRYWPAYAEIKKLLDDGKYGKVKYAEFARFSATPTWCWNNWLLDGKLSGNAALDLHIHDVDTILHFFGFPSSLRSAGVQEEDGSVSHIATLYTYEDFVVSSTGGWICTDSFGFNMRAFFVLEMAAIEMDFSKEPVVMVYPQGGEKYALFLPDGDGYYHELADFIAGVEQGQLSGIVTPESAADSVRLCLEEIRSAKENKELEILST
ncbi:MAG: Gfo/Idh/MocA family oxidoreductase [bacterium]|nr:Gfo/Idh/MocA family oxidoreductase [bacterium]